MGLPRFTPMILSAAALVWLAGCSKEEMADVFDKGMQQVEETVAKTTELVKEQADLAGHFELTLDGPVKTGRCYVSLISFPSGRPGVLQISSCKQSGDETFPSLFLRAEVSAGTLAELAEEKLAAQLYVQAEPEGPVWHSPDDQPVELTISTAGDTSVEGQLLRGSLINTDTGQSVAVTGKFIGSLQ